MTIRDYTGMNYEDCVRTLIDVFRGNGAIALFLGRTSWDEVPRKSKTSYKNFFIGYNVPHMIYEGSYREKVLVLGADRVNMAFSLHDMAARGKFTSYQRNQYIMCLTRGEFPDEANDNEVMLAFESVTYVTPDKLMYYYSPLTEKIHVKIKPR